MPGVFKIGMTERSPEERLSEANLPHVFTPWAPYVIEVYKKVKNCKETEKMIHALIYDKRLNPNKEFFKITIEELKDIFNGIDEDNENIIEIKKLCVKKENLINKINNDIFDVLRMFNINKIHFNGSSIDLNHDEKRYNYEFHSSDNLVHIINIILSIESHIFGNDMLEFYVLHYIRKKTDSTIHYNDIKEHFKFWCVNSTSMDKCKKEFHKYNYYKNNYFKHLKEYISKIHKYDSDNQIWFDIELLDDYRNNNHYQATYNILDHYKEDLLSLNKLKKECTINVGDKIFSLHKYIESKIIK
jgi:hypothetical protein